MDSRPILLAPRPRRRIADLTPGDDPVPEMPGRAAGWIEGRGRAGPAP